jgi:hypothetical protein
VPHASGSSSVVTGKLSDRLVKPTGDNPGQVAMTNVICQKESNLVLRGRGGSYHNICKEHNRDIG